MMGDTSRVVRIDADGEQTVAAMLPSIAVGTDNIGGARLALLDGELYATVGQWLGDLGEDRMPLEGVVARINADGTVEEAGTTWDVEAAENPGGFHRGLPPLRPGCRSGRTCCGWRTPAAMTCWRSTPPRAKSPWKRSSTAFPDRCPTPTATAPWRSDPVPTGVAFDEDGTAYVSLLSGFPFVPGSAKVVTVDADGNVADYATGLTMLTDLRAGPDGNLYAVQIAVFTDQGPTPNSGAIVRIMEGDASEVVLGGLSFPTSIDFNDDGDAYITINGVGAPGSGEVVMVAGLTDAPGMPIGEAMAMPSEEMPGITRSRHGACGTGGSRLPDRGPGRRAVCRA